MDQLFVDWRSRQNFAAAKRGRLGPRVLAFRAILGTRVPARAARSRSSIGAWCRRSRLRHSAPRFDRPRRGRSGWAGAVTDHKTGKADGKPGQVIDGGKSLQPLFYALAAEKLFAGEGRLNRFWRCAHCHDKSRRHRGSPPDPDRVRHEFLRRGGGLEPFQQLRKKDSHNVQRFALRSFTARAIQLDLGERGQSTGQSTILLGMHLTPPGTKSSGL
jgi:hypothetical protein